MRVKKYFLVMTAFSVFGGCAVFTPVERQPGTNEIPPVFTLFDPVSSAPDYWWETFESDELNRLMALALGGGNLSIQEAYARMEQARAAALKAGAAQIPGLDISAGYGVTRQAVDQGSALDGRSTTRKISAGLAVPSYELDIWGRVRALNEASRRELRISAEDLRTVYLSVAAEIADRWLELQYNRQVHDVLDRQLDANRESLELIEARFRLGRSTALDVYQQRQIVASAEALQPDIRGRLAELENEIAVLAGKPAGTDLRIAREKLPKPPHPPDPGIPADVLAQRPDVRRAGLALEAADWRVAAARADRLPAIRLSGSHTYASDDMESLLNNWITNLAAALTGPVFDAGRRRYETDRARAAAAEKLAAYRMTVLNAVMEVQNILIRYNAQRQTMESQELQLALARDAYRESMDRYRTGSIDYLPVLTALSQAQQLERSLLQSRYRILAQYVALHRALGGNWMDRLEPGYTMKTGTEQNER
jgi:outer membrane protein, multidrug efflux system